MLNKRQTLFSLNSLRAGILIITSFVYAAAFAEIEGKEVIQTPQSTQTTQPPASPIVTNVEKHFLQSNIEISNWVDHFAKGLDSFLSGGEEVAKQENHTHVDLENSTYIIDRKKTNNATNFAVNLNLPNTEKYWNLKFSTYDENQERGISETALRQTPRERNYGASLAYLRDVQGIRVSFRPRIEFHTPLRISHSLKFEKTLDYKTWFIYPKLELFTNAYQGVGIFHSFSFNFILNDTYAIALLNDGQYLNQIHTYTTTNGPALRQIVDDRTSLTYGIYFTGNNQPNYHLESYLVSVIWRQQIYRKILDYEIQPQWNFARRDGFVGDPGLVFTVDIHF